MSLSPFAPNPTGPGGTITVYLNNQVVGTWNATNDNGTYVPNGFYHFVLQEHTNSGDVVQLERDSFISTFHGQAVSFTALPNVVHPGDTVLFNASYAGIGADQQSKIKIFTVSGELLQTLSLSGGAATWDGKNNIGQELASGIYLAVLDGIDPANGQSVRCILKLLFTH